MKTLVKDRPFDEISIGDKAKFTKTVSAKDVESFAEITGDRNPVHLDEEFAANSMFKRRIVHGMLSASLISTVLGTDLPGANTIYMSQEVKFLAPVFLGDTLTAVIKVIEKKEDKRTLTFHTVVKNQDGKTVVDGQAKVMKAKN